MSKMGNFSVRALALAILSASSLTMAHAELVYDDESGVAPPRVEDRDQLRKVYQTTQKVETAHELTDDASEVVATETVDGESPSLNRSELLRRKRIREEMKNEDLLSQRLEELRLREEEKRTKKILKSAGMQEEAPEGEAEEEMPAPRRRHREAPSVAREELVEETSIAPSVTEVRPAPATIQVTQVQPAPAPAPVPAPVPVASDRISYTSSSTVGSSAASTASTEDASTSASQGQLTISPRFGFLSISNNDYYQFNSRYAAGIGAAFGVSDHLSIELGYTYSQNSLTMPTYTTFAASQINYNQNLFDIAMKLGFTGNEYRIKPYVSGGAGYSMGYINYDARAQAQIRAYQPFYGTNTQQDYQLNQIVGTVGAGLDFKIAKNATIGAGYRLVKPLSSSENQQIYNYAFGVDPARAQARGSIEGSTMHLFMVSGGFSF